MLILDLSILESMPHVEVDFLLIKATSGHTTREILLRNSTLIFFSKEDSTVLK